MQNEFKLIYIIILERLKLKFTHRKINPILKLNF